MTTGAAVSLYDKNEHRHRFAAWAAARAAQRGLKGATVSAVVEAIENSCDIRQFVEEHSLEAIDDEQFNELHLKWCISIKAHLENNIIAKVTFGRVAKIVAIYLKVMVVLSEYSSPLAKVAHPPIDRILLFGVAADPNILQINRKDLMGVAWTKLDQDSYYHLISQLKACVSDEAFWKLERYWSATSEEE